MEFNGLSVFLVTLEFTSWSVFLAKAGFSGWSVYLVNGESYRLPCVLNGRWNVMTDLFS